MTSKNAGSGGPAGADHNSTALGNAGVSNVDLSAEGLASGGSRTLRGYLAEPKGEGPFPAVLMIHEAFGLDHITVRHADRMAAAAFCED